MLKYLLITAHPDDECMFFTPIIRTIIKNGNEIDLMCLSSGDFDGMGPKRMKELKNSAKVLGIKSLFIIEDVELKDGPKNIWKPDVILKHLRSLPNSRGYSAIITFDDSGVSGHPNHCAISKAMKHQNDFKVQRLKSLPLWLKYLGPIGGFISKFIYSEYAVFEISLREAYEYGYKAMLQHESQLLWFRRLYIIFSVYMTVNIFTDNKAM